MRGVRSQEIEILNENIDTAVGRKLAVRGVLDSVVRIGYVSQIQVSRSLPASLLPDAMTEDNSKKPWLEL
jgi:hypothetical protein